MLLSNINLKLTLFLTKGMKMNVIIFCVDVSKVMVAVLILILIVNDVLMVY